MPASTRLLRFSSVFSGSNLQRLSKSSRQEGNLRCSTGFASKTSAATAAPPSMDSDAHIIVKGIHETSTKAVFYVTGGGLTALSWLLAVPGASGTVLEAVVPYAQTASDLLLGGPPSDSYSGKQQSMRLAAAAYRKAAKLTSIGELDFVGVATACALATGREKKGLPPSGMHTGQCCLVGDHRCCISIHSCRRQATYTALFEKGARSRMEEEVLTSRLLLSAVASAMGSMSEAEANQSMQACLKLPDRDAFSVEFNEFDDPIQSLLKGTVSCVEFHGANFVLDAPRTGALLLPGSFNPVHDGHLGLLAAAEKQTGLKGMFELSVLHPDKGPLSEGVIKSRLEPFVLNGQPIVLTRAALFSDKAAMFPGCTLGVGYDTAERLIHPKYYGDSVADVLVDLGTIRNNGCRFLVAGRAADQNGSRTFLTIEDLQVPDGVEDLFYGLEDFRLDVSSTEIRKRKGL